MSVMDLIVVESPFAPQTPRYEGAHEGTGDHGNCAKCVNEERRRWEAARNMRYLRAALADCFRRGEAPFASHAIYTQEGVLDDTDPEQRKLGMEAGFAWGAKADTTAVYTDLGVSRGMEEGIARAHAAGRSVVFRTLPASAYEPRGRTCE